MLDNRYLFSLLFWHQPKKIFLQNKKVNSEKGDEKSHVLVCNVPPAEGQGIDQRSRNYHKFSSTHPPCSFPRVSRLEAAWCYPEE